MSNDRATFIHIIYTVKKAAVTFGVFKNSDWLVNSSDKASAIIILYVVLVGHILQEQLSLAMVVSFL